MSDHIAAPPSTSPALQVRGGKSYFTGDEVLTTAIQTASCIDSRSSASSCRG